MKRDQILGLVGAFLLGLASVPLLAWMTGVQRVFEVEPEGGALPALDIGIGFLFRTPGASGPSSEASVVLIPALLLIVTLVLVFLSPMVRRIGFAVVAVVAGALGVQFFLQFGSVLSKASETSGANISGGAVSHIGPGFWALVLAIIVLIVAAAIGQGGDRDAAASGAVSKRTRNADESGGDGAARKQRGRRAKTSDAAAENAPSEWPVPTPVAEPITTAALTSGRPREFTQAALPAPGETWGIGQPAAANGWAESSSGQSAYDQNAYDQSQGGYDQSQYAQGYDQNYGTSDQYSGDQYPSYGTSEHDAYGQQGYGQYPQGYDQNYAQGYGQNYGTPDQYSNDVYGQYPQGYDQGYEQSYDQGYGGAGAYSAGSDSAASWNAHPDGAGESGTDLPWQQELPPADQPNS